MCFQIWGWFYQITILWQIIAKHKSKKFFVGSIDILQSNRNSDFKKMRWKNILENGGGSWFNTFMQKTLYFLDRPPG